MAARLAQSEAVRRMVEARPEFDYSSFVYAGSSKKSAVICPKHGPFPSTYDSIVGGHGCPSCKGAKIQAVQSADPSKAILQMRLKRPEYDFSGFEYVGNKAKSAVVCKTHGAFQMSHASIMRGRGCPACGTEARTKERSLTQQEAIERMTVVAPHYDYSRFTYRTNSTKSVVVCSKHGQFLTSYVFIVGGTGCKKCAHERLTLEKRIPFVEFMERVIDIHGDTYSYDESSFTGVSSTVIAECRTHGDFKVGCWSHLSGQGCPDCKDKVFNPKKRAFLYIYRLLKDGVNYVGYGITGNPTRRDAEHHRRASTGGVTCERTHLFRFRRGYLCRDVETLISKRFNHVNLGVRGFRKEATSWENYESLVDMATDLAGRYGGVSDFYTEVSTAP